MQNIKPEIQKLELLKTKVGLLIVERYKENRIKGLSHTEAETETTYKNLSKIQIELIEISTALEFKRKNKYA